MRLLVTKNIAQNFRTRILAMGYSVVEYPLIRKVPLDYTQKNEKASFLWFFTIKNANSAAFCAILITFWPFSEKSAAVFLPTQKIDLSDNWVFNMWCSKTN